MLIVNRIGNNRNHREAPVKASAAPFFCWFEWGGISMVYVWGSGQTRVSAR